MSKEGRRLFEFCMMLVPLFLVRKPKERKQLPLPGPRTELEVTSGLLPGDEKLAPKLVLKWEKEVDEALKLHPAVPEALVFAIIHAGSRGNEDANTQDGKQGLMELTPKMQQQNGVSDPFDAWDNLEGGVNFLEDLIERPEPSRENTIATYRFGSNRHYTAGASRRIPKDVGIYVRRIQNLTKHYEEMGLK